MAVSLSANVRNRRKGRDNHTDREGRKPPNFADSGGQCERQVWGMKTRSLDQR
jgi:hypothetical protein